MQKDAFKPQGRELGVIDVGNPLNGQAPARRIAPQAPAMSRMPQAPQMQAQPQAPMVTEQAPMRGAQISSERSVPRGAQVVQLAGSQPNLAPANFERGGNSFQPSAPANVLPTQEQIAPQAQAPAMGQPQPFLRRPQFQRPAVTTFRVTMRGIGPDGAEYASVYDAEFPAGTQPSDLDFAQIS